ncbi:hypothetical protein Aple_103120 [Acrocarpospora pleiomorpha]|uniref:Uncharacterized protein n=1 Tax=Acrocarpospora pleiomorpha TaxID=90975 RepID=A0A5M3Y269_9ACTN|nr:hypothetical protein Aple_103120 [Acrocarpospora pleiomorpha]
MEETLRKTRALSSEAHREAVGRQARQKHPHVLTSHSSTTTLDRTANAKHPTEHPNPPANELPTTHKRGPHRAHRQPKHDRGPANHIWNADPRKFTSAEGPAAFGAGAVRTNADVSGAG